MVKHLTSDDLQQIRRLAALYVGISDPSFLTTSATIDARELALLAQAFLQVYSDKPARDDDPVPSDE